MLASPLRHHLHVFTQTPRHQALACRLPEMSAKLAADPHLNRLAPFLHARIKLLAEQRASKSKLASEDEKARVRRVTPVTACVSDEGSEATFERAGTLIERAGTFRHAFRGSILKTLAVQRLGASAVQPSGRSPTAAPEALASPCAQLRRELSQSCRRGVMSSSR